MTVSVIVVSRHREAALLRCLQGLQQQDHPGFEVIVVADPAGLLAVAALGLAVKRVAFDAANISAARNAGLAQAAGGVVAFIDDDAVAEPTWLSRLVAPFGDARVVAAAGFVRGRNGISYQWQATEVDCHAQDHALPVPDGVSLHAGKAGRAMKTQGTNCAFRRHDLLAIGGFDPAYRFYLDEADVNLRLESSGLTAVVTDAQVHHGFAASARRRADRVPLSLFEIAASTAVFLRRHAPEGPDYAAWLRLQNREAARLEVHLAAGRLEAVAADRLLAGLSEGWSEGLDRVLPVLAPLAGGDAGFLALPGTGPRPGRVIAGRIWQRRRLMAEAQAAQAAGAVVTVICLAPTPRAHRMAFQGGIWVQEGGLYGRSDRSGPKLRLIRFARRVAEETARIAPLRPVAGAR